MDFRKILYSNPEYQETSPEEVDPETFAHSQQVASEKLARLSDPSFRRFAIRFMNIGEYRRMIEEGKFGGSSAWGEVNVIDLDTFFDKPPENVLKTLPYFSLFPSDHTNWNILEESKSLSRGLNAIVQNVERERKEASRNEKLSLIREKILEYIQHHPKLGFLKRMKGENGDFTKNYEIIERFENDPSYVKEKGALREIINAIVYAADKINPTIYGRGGGPLRKQYELAVLFDSDALKIIPKSGRPWGSVRGFEESNISPVELERSILGAVSIMDTKDIENEMVHIEQGSRNMAHPVFSVVGKGQSSDAPPRLVVRYPR